MRYSALGALVLVWLVAPAPRARAQACLPYEPQPVTLSGTIVRHTFPGPPNYEDIKAGDKPETMWLLRLASPICVTASGKDDPNSAEHDVRELQLNFTDAAAYTKYRALVGKRVTVSGALTHAITAHHHTPVMIAVHDIVAAR